MGRIGGVEQVAPLVCLRLCSSLKAFVMACPTARQECGLAGQVAGFAALGGVPHRLTSDNLGSAVPKVLRGRTRQEHEPFVACRSHYLFDSHCCLPGQARAHEKPLVETLVGYARRHFLVPVPAVPAWEALTAMLAARCAAADRRTVVGRDRTIGALWPEEPARLRPLPRPASPCCRTVAVTATRHALVTFERNRYSVPSRQAGERLLLRAFPWPGALSDGQAVVAHHPRLYGRDGAHLAPLHYVQVLEHKPGGFELARPIQRGRTRWPPVYQAYLDALRRARPADATRQFVRVRHLRAQCTPDQIVAALDQALVSPCWAADGVAQLLRQALGPPPPPSILDLAAAPGVAPLARGQLPLPAREQFSRLLAREEVPS